MPALKDALTSEDKRKTVVDDCCGILDLEVAEKRGVSGLAIKAGFKAVKGIKPGFIRQAVHDLVPEFADALDPLYQEALGSDGPVGAFFERRSSDVAEALLAITDGKAERSSRRVIKSTYSRLRPSAKRNVEAAVPRLGKLIEKYAP